MKFQPEYDEPAAYGPDPTSIARQLGAILSRGRNYREIAAKALHVETLPDGALPIYDLDYDRKSS